MTLDMNKEPPKRSFVRGSDRTILGDTLLIQRNGPRGNVFYIVGDFRAILSKHGYSIEDRNEITNALFELETYDQVIEYIGRYVTVMELP